MAVIARCFHTLIVCIVRISRGFFRRSPTRFRGLDAKIGTLGPGVMAVSPVEGGEGILRRLVGYWIWHGLLNFCRGVRAADVFVSSRGFVDSFGNYRIGGFLKVLG